MATIQELRAARLEKLKRLQKEGLVYPAQVRRTHNAEQALEEFAKLSKSQKEIILAGRIRSIRGHGGSTFVHIEDGSGQIQAYFKKDRIGEKPYQFFEFIMQKLTKL